jgi:hypothetical protein
MLKLTVAALAFALASTASAAGWRKLRIDASSDTSFQESVALFQDKLSPSRRVAFAMSLEDIWLAGSRLAEEQQREYTQADYLRQLDGLGYEQVTKLADPTGEKAKQYRAEYYYARARGGNQRPTWYGSETPWVSPTGGPPPVQNGVYRGATRAIDSQQH